MAISRRNLLASALFGAGGIGLRALATGIPAAVLLNPRRAAAAEAINCFDPAKAQFMILSTTSHGCPLNANVPGTYEDPNVVHPLSPDMAPTTLSIRGQSYTAAKPWATLQQNVLDRTAFIHHATMTNSHGDQRKVMSLMGGVSRQEMMVSMFAKQVAPCLGTIQTQPISVGAYSPLEGLNFEGRNLPMLTPVGLATTLASPTGPLANLEKLRDADLLRLNDLFKSSGTAAQRAFLDRYATSQSQLRSISQSLLGKLNSLTNNTVPSQITAAVTLIEMKVSPVVSVHIPFGSDNHGDPGLAQEVRETVSGVAALNQLMTELGAAGLQDRVTFLALNVFGRNLYDKGKGLNGRDHYANHHCSVVIGKPIQGGVYGGITPDGADAKALPINSATGRGEAGGDIAFADTLAAVGKTVGTAVGVDPAVLDKEITTGKVIAPVLV